jgi:hypothetical protein
MGVSFVRNGNSGELKNEEVTAKTQGRKDAENGTQIDADERR